VRVRVCACVSRMQGNYILFLVNLPLGKWNIKF